MGIVDIDPGPWAAWISIAAIVLGALLSAGAFYISAQIRATLTKELGGNGGGLREALNAVRQDVADLKESDAVASKRMDDHQRWHAEH